MPITVTIKPVKPIKYDRRLRDAFDVYLDNQWILVSRVPFLATSRYLLDHGYLPSTVLQLQHIGTGTRSLRGPIGPAALLRVRENNRGTPVFKNLVQWE